MFSKIRQRITLFNLFTLVVFLLFFIVALLAIIWWSFKVSGEAYLIGQYNHIIGQDEDSAGGALVNTNFHENLGSTYIIWSDSGILAQSVTNNELINEAYELIEDRKNGFSVLSTDQGTFRVYTNTVEINKNDETIQVFQNITAENSLIPYFVFYLILIGIIGILALIPISFFLAGKSLIPIKKSFEDQKKFIADASHELRSPLTVIRSSLDILSLKEDSKISENKKWLDNISLESENLSNLISEMLLIAQADSNRLQFDTRTVDISELSHEVCDLMTTKTYEKDQTLRTSIEPDIMINGDVDKLRQLLRIFLDNAIKYTPNGGEIFFKLRKDRKKNIIFSVKDTGIGISEKNLDRIFDRFFRCDNARGRDNGSGLGLNIASTIVDYYNGNIQTESKLNEGTTFTVSLPSNK